MQTRRKIYRILRNKYILSIMLFSLWLLFFDQNNLVNRFQEMRRINQLEADKEYFRERISADSARLNELKTDRENLEKFAREQYLMKRENEDIFIIEFED
ncbi:MAG: septum formation initiator family protein [Marinilabiliales bacterium]|nr:MAG: septum formation initiator family protein [Marinilabiliales bacterium]